MQPGIQKSTLDLIKQFEGVKYNAYKDSAGLWTTGVGHLIKPNEQYLIAKTLTDDDVDELLSADTLISTSFVRNHVTPELSQNQFDALNSIAYNIGVTNFQTSTLLKNINSHIPILEGNFTCWDKVHKDGILVEVDGLLERRKKEYQLFIS